MSSQDVRMFGNPLPIDQLENLLIELGESCHARGKASARNCGAYAVDDEMIDGAQDEAGETAAAIIGFETPVIVVDQRKANILISVPPCFLGMRKPFSDQPDDVGTVETLKGAPTALRIRLQHPQHALGQEVTHAERDEVLERAAARVTRKLRESIGAQRSDGFRECFACLGIFSREKAAAFPNGCVNVLDELRCMNRVGCSERDQADEIISSFRLQPAWLASPSSLQRGGLSVELATLHWGILASGANLRATGRLRCVYKRFKHWSHVMSSMVMPLASPLDGQMCIFDGRNSARSGKCRLEPRSDNDFAQMTLL